MNDIITRRKMGTEELQQHLIGLTRARTIPNKKKELNKNYCRKSKGQKWSTARRLTFEV